MAPKKKEVQKLSYGEFMANDSFGGSWADEVEETVGTQALPPMERRGGGGGGNSFYNSSGPRTDDRGFSYRDPVPQRIPDKPPYLAHLGNLDYEISEPDIRDLLDGCDVTSIRLIEDRETRRPKGFGYAEFANVDGLKRALELDGSSFRGRNIKVKIADPPKERDNRGGEGSSRDLSEWTRKGPLPDLPSARNNERRPAPDFAERRPPRDAPTDEKPRDLTWERKGPLSPLPQQERPADPAREGGRSESFRGPRKPSPATWGEGRPEGGAAAAGAAGENNRPHREFTERPERPERAPTAAERDMQWRSNMRPDAPVKSPAPSRSGSEAPSSPAPAAAVLASRPKLNLAKRTVSEAPDAASSSAGDAKASPFGAARPIDTATREREVEEKRQIAIREKKEADEKAKEEAKKAKEAAAQEAAAAKEAAEEAEKAAPKEEAAAPAAEAPAATEAAKAESAEEKTAEPAKGVAAAAKTGAPQNGSTAPNQRGPRPPREPREPREPRGELQNAKSRANDSGNWRQPSGEQRGPRAPREPRGPTDGQRRGSGAPRGPRNNDGPRPPRAANGGQQSQPSTPKLPQEEGAAPATPSGPDEEGWETVPNKGRRSQKPRAQ